MTDSNEDIKGYFALMEKYDALSKKFMDQPWVSALLDRYTADNASCVPLIGREAACTQTQYIQARKFLNQRGKVMLFGYALIPGDN